jgi:SAM-dependent methyltransferase
VSKIGQPRPDVGQVRINLGAGLQFAPGWINYDRSRSGALANNPIVKLWLPLAHRFGLASKATILPWPKETRVHDLRRGIPHGDSSVDVVYTSHFLEHLSADDARRVIAEAFRVLKPGGWIRIVVPDLRRGARAYLDGDREFFQSRAHSLADGFVDWLALRPAEKGGRLERLGRRLLHTDEDGHKWMYDGESVVQRLTAQGFVDACVVEFRQGRCTSAARLDSRPHDSVHVEARKRGKRLPVS